MPQEFEPVSHQAGGIFTTPYLKYMTRDNFYAVHFISCPVKIFFPGCHTATSKNKKRPGPLLFINPNLAVFLVIRYFIRGKE